MKSIAMRVHLFSSINQLQTFVQKAFLAKIITSKILLTSGIVGYARQSYK